MVKRKVANPAPAALAIVNPNGGRKTMSTERKTGGGTKPRTTTQRATNAPKRRTGSTARRAGNPSSRGNRFALAARKRRRASNPSGALTDGLTLGAASAVVEAVSAFVPNVGGASLLASAARTAATGLVLGKAAEQFSMTRKYATSLKVAGIAIGAAKVVSYFATPYIKRAISSATGAGMQGIAYLPNGASPYAPAFQPAPQPAKAKATAGAGVQGIAYLR